MKSTAVSLNSHYSKLFQNPKYTFDKEYIFPKMKDFGPHAETFLGPVPMLYTLSTNLKKEEGWVETKDGWSTLIPFILFEEVEEKVKIIYPAEARFFLENEPFYYSRLEYEDKKRFSDYCYLYVDYYEEFSTKVSVKEKFEYIEKISGNYKELKICFTTSTISSNTNSTLSLFLDSIRQLPKNCSLISKWDFFECHDFQQRDVFLLTEQDFVLRSPWENICASRGGRLDRPKLDESDKEHFSYGIYPGVKKVIYQHNNSDCILTPENRLEIKKLVEMLKSREDLLSLTYLRHMREWKNYYKE